MCARLVFSLLCHHWMAERIQRSSRPELGSFYIKLSLLLASISSETAQRISVSPAKAAQHLWSSMCSSFFPRYANPYILEISINNSFLKRKHGKSVLLNSATFSNIKLMLTPQWLYNAVIESTNGEMQLSKESRAGTLVQLCLHLQLYRSFSKKHQQNILCRLITNTENKCILFLSKVEYTLANERITENIERSSSPIPLQMSKGKNQDHKK